MKTLLRMLSLTAMLAFPVMAQAQWVPQASDSSSNNAQPAAAAAATATAPAAAAPTDATAPAPTVAAPAPAATPAPAAAAAPTAPADTSACEKMMADHDAKLTKMQDTLTQMQPKPLP